MRKLIDFVFGFLFRFIARLAVKAVNGNGQIDSLVIEGEHPTVVNLYPVGCEIFRKTRDGYGAVFIYHSGTTPSCVKLRPGVWLFDLYLASKVKRVVETTDEVTDGFAG